MQLDSQVQQEITINGVTYVVKNAHVKYHVQNHNRISTGSLIDGGAANGGLSGTDVRVLNESLVLADVTGIGGGVVNNLPLCTVAGFINTLQGPIIGIFHQYAHYGEGTTIHSVPQLLHFGMNFDEKAIKSSMGKQ